LVQSRSSIRGHLVGVLNLSVLGFIGLRSALAAPVGEIHWLRSEQNASLRVARNWDEIRITGLVSGRGRCALDRAGDVAARLRHARRKPGLDRVAKVATIGVVPVAAWAAAAKA
jgi:hypothetical protein